MKVVRSKPVIFSLIIALVLFGIPELLQGQEAGQGNLRGYVYASDNTTPVPGAVVKLRNLSTGALYESLAADGQGMVELQGVDEGLYLIGISTAEGDFNIENLVGVKPNETSRIAFSLRPQEQEGTALETSKRCPKGDWYVPDIKGQCDKNYKWNAATEQCECQKRGPLAFFLTPLGAALILAASAGVVTFALTTDGEPSGSAFK